MLAAAVTDLSVQQQDQDLEEEDFSNKNTSSRQKEKEQQMLKNESMASIISSLTTKVGVKKARNQQKFSTMQKSISQALEKWKYEELMMNEDDVQKNNRSGSVKKPG